MAGLMVPLGTGCESWDVVMGKKGRSMTVRQRYEEMVRLASEDKTANCLILCFPVDCLGKCRFVNDHEFSMKVSRPDKECLTTCQPTVMRVPRGRDPRRSEATCVQTESLLQHQGP